ncbi:MAG: glycosyltransferase family 4 protein [Armatimonadota bacterium]
MDAEHGRPRVCIVHTGRAVPEMLLGTGVERSGGAELQLAEIARTLAGRGWEVAFAFYEYGDAVEQAVLDGVALIGSPPPAGGPPGLRFATRTVPACRQLLRRTSADVYLQMGVGWQNALLVRWCRGQGRRFVLWMASITDPVCDDPRQSRLPAHERWLARYGIRNADLLVAQTRDQQRLLADRHGRDSVLIRNLFAPAHDLRPPPRDPPRVLWAATMRHLKRPHLFLDIAEALPEIRFIMAGGPADDDRELFEEVRARAAGISNVTFLGFVPYREIDAYYRQASAYLCTSTIEGFSNSVLQSWSHGRPVVSTFDPDGLIEEHNLGFYRTDPADLIEAVRLACENSDDYIAPARAYLLQNHAPEVVLPRIESVLQGDTSRLDR